ncbi:Sporulation kinase D [compost metagenome]
MVLNWIFYTYALFFLYASIIMQESVHPFLLTFCFILMIISQRTQMLQGLAPWLRLTIIGCLHYVGQNNYALPIYLWSLAQETYMEDNRFRAWSQTAGYAAIFIGVTIATTEGSLTVSNLPYYFFIIFNFITVVWFARSLLLTAQKTEAIKSQQAILSTRDTLTGLYNYEECHKQLAELVKLKKPILLVLIDCTDLKSMNSSEDFQAGNLILKQVAELLKILFSESLFIARYGGDEFAIATSFTHLDEALTFINHQLDSELPKLTGIQITYGISIFPDHGLTKDELILVAENNLFMKKREMWLKREEHLLRSEKLRVVGELASGMAHEIRNPLTTVKGFLQISKANGYNIENWYSLIMDEISRMSDLTAEFLQFSKPHSTQFQLKSLHDCILRVISLSESEATRLGHEIQYESPNEPVFVLMDQDKMVQLVLNIVKNAYEAMSESGLVKLKLTLRNGIACLEIQDTGQGIPSDQLEQIFHPFYTTKESGTGLGLSICHKIVQDHKGALEVLSKLNVGTRFIISLPLYKGDSHATPNEAGFS